VAVHFAGHPCRLSELKRVADRYGAVLIEDAAHALGAERQEAGGAWRRIGCGADSALTTLSFHPVKHITTGEGGAVLSNDAELLARVRLLRSHGITKDPEQIARGQGPWYYEMRLLGYNYRITDVQCALGVRQLARADRFVARRREIAARYTDAFRACAGVRLPVEREGFRSSCHLYVIQFVAERLAKAKGAIVEELAKRGIRTQVHYIPIHLQPYYRERFGFREGDFPIAEAYYRRALSLPLYPAMTEEEIERVIRGVTALLAG
jgi:dTDP-4-amino-4,6-dideoxygalactose transaminase